MRDETRSRLKRIMDRRDKLNFVNQTCLIILGIMFLYLEAKSAGILYQLDIQRV